MHNEKSGCDYVRGK